VSAALCAAAWLAADLVLDGLFAGEVSVESLTMGLVVLSMLGVGGLVAGRVPRNAVGWLVLATGALWAFQAVTQGYAHYGLTVAPGAVPGATVALWWATWLWIPGLLLLPTYGLLLFPDGRLPAARWRPVLWTVTVGLGLSLLAQWGARWGPDAYHFAFAPEARNPLHVPALEAARRAVAVLGGGLLAAGVAGSVAAAIVRFRRARGDERRQMRWVVFGVTASLALYLLGVGASQLAVLLGAEPPGRIDGILAAVALGAFPITIAVAVLRFRLYEIDRIISRTVAYAAVVTILAVVYASLVVGLQAALAPVTSGSELTVAGSTLVVAALFGPLRRRVRSIVERRFDRARYDARTTVEAFANRLRDEVALDALVREVQAVAAATVRPRHVGLWLRHDGQQPRPVTVPERSSPMLRGNHPRTVTTSDPGRTRPARPTPAR
jgi:hypothetical protein